ncbi:MAG TPA: 30S ribosomal protein S5 [Patescibacteria group bacterium]|nr:30S ribosomal protein S5 [Patescibacteria group bacterium]
MFRPDTMNQGRPFSEYEEKVIQIKRISKKTKGGNQIRFSALVVVGDKKGKVGVALSKAQDVRSAITKAISSAKRRMDIIPLAGTTIPFSISEKFSAARVMLKPAPPGSGIIAGGPVRVILEAAGIKDASGKILGTKNKASNVYATLAALKKISQIDRKRKNRKE